MARTILHCCGHEQVRFVPGFFAGDRKQEAARMARRRYDCCWEASGGRPRRCRPTMARCWWRTCGAAPCGGSPKQVAWAETIRAKRVAAVVRAGSDGAERLAAVDEARWWTDHRAEPVERLLTRCRAAPVRAGSRHRGSGEGWRSIAGRYG